MMLIDNWRETLRHAWSVRFNLLSAAFAFIEMWAPQVSDGLQQLAPFLPPKVVAALSATCAIVAFVARFVPQKKVSG